MIAINRAWNGPETIGADMGMIFTVIVPVLPAIADHYGGGDRGKFVAQMIMTMPSIGLITGGIISGWLVDRFGARNILFIGLLLFAVSGSAGFYVGSANQLLAARLLLGVASTTITTATAWLLGASFDPITRVQLLGYRNALGSFGGVVSIFLAGPVAEYLGWKMPFSFYLLSLLVLAGALVSVPRFAAAQQAVREETADGNSLLRLWPVYAMTIPICVLLMTSSTQLSFLLSEDGINTPTIQSWVIGTASVTSVIGSLFYGPVRIRLGSRYTFAVMMVLLGGGIAIIGLSHSALGASVGCAIAGIGGGISTPYLCNLILDRVSTEIRGRALGLLYSAMFLGDFFNPFVFYPINQLVGRHHAFLIVGTVGAIWGLGALMQVGRRQVLDARS
jgi:MFS family permease